ncbi:MAG: hypothetical protein OZ924_18070 [Burkholderiaceae bacterium]|nr:hypothetical protein [Burkholderiaceae bacterium]
MSKQQITFYVSAAEAAALKALVSDGNQSEYLRALIRRDAEERGVDWPDDALRDTRGRYSRQIAND